MNSMDRKLLHTVVAATAHRFPDRTAVVAGERGISYRSLVRRAASVAEALKALGAGRGTIVGVWMDSGIDYVTAILGILEAGGVFLPLDLAVPEKRLQTMLAATPPAVTITCAGPGLARCRRLAAMNLPVGLGRVLVMDGRGAPCFLGETGGSAAVEGAPEPLPLPDPDDPAYIVFTSGTTGVPKAILGRQKSLSHFMHWEVREFGLDDRLKVSQLAPVTFDASLRDIFTPLITGGTVFIPEPSIKGNVDRLLAWIEKTAITLVHCTPSLFRLMIRALATKGAGKERLPALERILLAGEALYGRDAMRWMDIFGGRIELVNLYGPSETTLVKTFHRVVGRPDNPDTVLPLGRPIANTAVLIMAGKRLCDIGETGEVCIKTPFMTLGYCNDPDRTGRRFVPNPLTGDTGDIVYRTGDMGCYLPDRQVAFLGRRDGQVKVNGVRVELAEVEGALMGFTGVDQAVVTAETDGEGNTALAAYYCGQPEITSGIIRTHLETVLPVAMLPAYLVRLDAMPLNRHGKVNRRDLPAPGLTPVADTPRTPPAGATEQALAGIWEAVLALPVVDAERSFFELGGHSLKAMRVVARISRELKVEIGLAAFFDNPTIRKLARLVDDATPMAATAIRPAPTDRPCPLLPAQRRLWILDRMGESQAAYTLAGGWLLKGSLEIPALESAIGGLIRRHESLRSTFGETDGEPELKIGVSLPEGPSLVRVTLDPGKKAQGRDQGEKDLKRCRTFIRHQARIPFDLSRGPLFRIHLATLGPHRFLLAFTIHHIIGDAWSFDLLARELSVLYAASLTHRPSPLPSLGICYRDIAAHQHALIQDGGLVRHGDYWHLQFAALPPVLDLHVDHPRPAVQEYRGAVVRLDLRRPIADGLRALGEARGATRFMVLMALVKTLLFRRTGQSDIVVGTPAAGRTHPDLSNQVGFFVNTLALRDRIDGTRGFEELLQQVKRTTLSAFDHQDYPFDRLVDELAPARDVSHAPLFDVMVVLHNATRPALALKDLKVVPVDVDPETSRFDLNFEFSETDDGIHVGLVYNVALFEAATIGRLGRHLTTLAAAVLKNPARPIETLEMIDDAEKRRLVREFNATGRPFPKDRSLVDLFEAQARRTPLRMALLCGPVRLTYQQLDRRADQLARFLVNRLDLASGAVVGLMVDRGPWSVTALLGILKAGGVYLPMEPVHPDERIAALLADSGCQALLTEPKHLARVKDLPVAAIIDLDGIDDDTEPGEPLAPACRPAPMDPAYLIYTSGSTGTPKGVVIVHRGFVNMILDQIRQFGITAGDRVLQFASPAFDASLSEIFMALLAGAAVVTVDKAVIGDPTAFLDHVERTGTTVITFPPVYLNALARRGLETVKTIITAGEPARVDDAVWYGAGKRVFNAYGPTETSVCATIHRVDPARSNGLRVPIGRPIANTAILILDGTDAPVPIGVPGEICIAGAGLAKGYLNRPELTDEKFFAHPLADDQRIYRTGDLGRFLPDGEVEFLGRLDDQIKIRGHRVEPGEIAHALMRHPRVDDAVVLAVNEVLAAYVVVRDTVDPVALTAFLSGRLPPYMIPARLVVVDRIPLTANGKVDKAALAAAGEGRLWDGFTPPVSDLEKRLARLWETVLERRPVGLHDNFFDLGGDSLKAVRLVSRAFPQFGPSLTTKRLFLNPTVARLARAIGNEGLKATAAGEKKGTELPEAAATGLTVERRSLAGLIAAGGMAPVHTAALSYLSEDLVRLTGMDPETIVQGWCHDRPVVSGVLETSLGRIAKVTLPRFAATLHDDTRPVAGDILKALELAGQIGAQTVSLTGLLPSATGMGRDLCEAAAGGNGLPQVTTGQATVTAVMALAIGHLLGLADRRMDDECLGVLGGGALARSVLGLLLATLPHPRAILLCDPQRGAAEMATFSRWITETNGFTGPVRNLEDGRRLPSGFYAARLIIGATAAPKIIDVDRLRAGTLIVDESHPHSFSTDRAISRMQRQGDILCTEGDVLASPTPITGTIYLPTAIEADLSDAAKQAIMHHQHATITGCVLSGLLSVRFKDLAPTTGAVAVETCRRHLARLQTQGYGAAEPHCAAWTAPTDLVALVRRQYGREAAKDSDQSPTSAYAEAK